MREILPRLVVCIAAALAAPALLHAQSADLVLCDRLAADPSDPDKPADVKGVAEIAASDVATAVKYCAVAAKSSRRAMYQLAAAQNHPAALERIGTFAAEGRGGPKDADAANA